MRTARWPYVLNASLFVLPPVAIYLIWKRSLSLGFIVAAAAVFVAAALLINLYPLRDPGDTAALVAIHLPILLILFLGVLYGRTGLEEGRHPGWISSGSRARSSSTRCSSDWAGWC